MAGGWSVRKGFLCPIICGRKEDTEAAEETLRTQKKWRTVAA
jgi:hypothetical protein